jgi:nucleotide-binding universal stress UspA family protein
MSLTTGSFRSILVPVDGSSLAELAIPYAVAIAKRAGSKVRLALVHHEIPNVAVLASPETYTRSRIQMQRSENVYLRSLTRRVRHQLGHPLSSVALEGPVAATLAEYIRDSGVDLVVMTTHGRGGMQRAWLGSATDQLIRTLDVPVLVLRAFEAEGAESSLPEILVPLDGSAVAEAALEPTVRMARLWQARVTLLRVVQPVLLATDPGVALPVAYDEELTQLEREAAESYLAHIAERLRQQGVKVTTITLLGSAIAETILELLQEGLFGLVALATHGRAGLGRVVLGSVADKLVRAAELPVLVVRSQAQRSPEAMTDVVEVSEKVSGEGPRQRRRRVPAAR